MAYTSKEIDIKNEVIIYIKEYDNFLNKVTHSIINKCKKLEFEDVKQQLILQLITNCKSYDSSHGIASTYFSKIILNAASNMIRKYWQPKNKINVECVSLDSYIEQPDYSLTFSVLINDDEESYFNPESYYNINEMIGKLDEIKHELSKFEKKIFDDFVNGETIKKIAKKYRKSPKTIYNIVFKIKEKIRKNLG